MMLAMLLSMIPMTFMSVSADDPDPEPCEHDWVDVVVAPTAGTTVTRVEALSCPHNPNVNGTVDPMRTFGGTIFGAMRGDDRLNSCPQFCPLGTACPDLFPTFTGGGTRGYTTKECANGCGEVYTIDGFTPFDFGHVGAGLWLGGGNTVMPNNPFKFTFRHHCDFGASHTQSTGRTTFSRTNCAGCGKHIDDASPADLYLTFDMPTGGRDRGSNTGTGAGSFGNWGLVPDEVVDRFIYTFNIVFPAIFDWHGSPLRPVTYQLDMADSVAWASGSRAGVALSWINRGVWDIDSQTHEIAHLAQNGYQHSGTVPSGFQVWEHYADYVRPYFGIFNRESGFLIPEFAAAGETWAVTYRPGAAFLRWIETHSEYWLDPINEGKFPEDYQSNFIQELHKVMRAAHANGSQGRGGTFYADNRQVIALTGFHFDDLHEKYQAWSEDAREAIISQWRQGYDSLEAAANGTGVDGVKRNSIVNMNPIFVDGGMGFGTVSGSNPRGGEGSTMLFDYVTTGGAFPAGTGTKYCHNLDTHGAFWAEWRYAEAFVATRLIFATSNDSFNVGSGRRLGDYVLSGSSDDGATWDVIYVGNTLDYSNISRRFFAMDLTGNTTAYNRYKLYCDTRGVGLDGTPEQVTRQLSVVALASACCELFPDCEKCEDCGACLTAIAACDICGAECDCLCEECVVCGISCNADCVPCDFCDAVCDDKCMVCEECGADCIFTCDCHICPFPVCYCDLPSGTMALVTAFADGNVRVDGVTFRLGRAFVTGVGFVNIAIPSNADLDGGLLGSANINVGQTVRLNQVVDSAGTTYPLYTLAATGLGTRNLIASNAMQAIRREVSWTGGTMTAGINWLFNNNDALFVNGRTNFVVGRVTSYVDGTFTIGSGVRGTVSTGASFTVPGNKETIIWNFPSSRQNQNNPVTVPYTRYALNAAELRAANLSRSGNDPQAIYALVWHAPGDMSQVLSVTFISDFASSGNGNLNLANYNTVNTAIARAEALDVERYVSLEAVDAAVAAVVRALLSSEQTRVNGFATAINNAIDALELTPNAILGDTLAEVSELLDEVDTVLAKPRGTNMTANLWANALTAFVPRLEAFVEAYTEGTYADGIVVIDDIEFTAADVNNWLVNVKNIYNLLNAIV